MLSERTLKILFDFKYQLHKGAEEHFKKDERLEEIQASIGRLKQAICDQNEEAFKTEFKFLFPIYQETVKASVDKKEIKGIIPKPAADFGFAQNKAIDKDVFQFFCQDTAPEMFDVYESLEKKEKPPRTGTSFQSNMSNMFLDLRDYFRNAYQKKKWEYWYWANLYYGKRNWRLPLLWFSGVISYAPVILGLLALPLVAPGHIPPWVLQLSNYFMYGFMTIGAVIAPIAKLEIFLLLLLVAAFIVFMHFCPPVAIGVVLFGPSVTPVMNFFLMVGLVIGCYGISSGIKSMIEPEINHEVDELFFSPDALNTLELLGASEIVGIDGESFQKGAIELKQTTLELTKALKQLQAISRTPRSRVNLSDGAADVDDEPSLSENSPRASSSSMRSE